MSTLAERYESVSTEVAEAISACGRAQSEVELIVISKNHGAELVRELHALGHRHFGENRDQEAKPKAEATSGLSGLVWHFVGQLQSNKAKSALSYSSVLHSLDRESLLQSVAKITPMRAAPLDVFIQLNLTDDPGRGGIQPENLSAFAEKVLAVEGINLLGVMGVAALDRAPEIDFETIASCSAELQKLHASAKFISAGMSGDFEKAISFGATHVRIGTAITGNRQY